MIYVTVGSYIDGYFRYAAAEAIQSRQRTLDSKQLSNSK